MKVEELPSLIYRVEFELRVRRGWIELKLNLQEDKVQSKVSSAQCLSVCAGVSTQIACF